MLKVFKSEIERLETAVTSAKRDLDKVASQHEAAVIRAAELADQVASAFADAAENADNLEQQHFQAELRAKSLATAVERARKRHSIAQHELAEAKAKAAAEKAAATIEESATEFEKAVAAVVKHMPALAHAMDGHRLHVVCNPKLAGSISRPTHSPVPQHPHKSKEKPRAGGRCARRGFQGTSQRRGVGVRNADGKMDRTLPVSAVAATC